MFPNLVYVSKQSSGNMELITTQRGKENVLFEGYRYRLDRNNLDGSSSWRCVRRDCVGCGRKLLDGSFIEIAGHAHAPDMHALIDHRALPLVYVLLFSLQQHSKDVFSTWLRVCGGKFRVKAW